MLGTKIKEVDMSDLFLEESPSGLSPVSKHLPSATTKSWHFGCCLITGSLTVSLLMLFLFLQPAFQPLIHEPLSNPEFLQNAVSRDEEVNRGTSNGSPECTHERQGNILNRADVASDNYSKGDCLSRD